jgi:SAM-dependent methyltransferase
VAEEVNAFLSAVEAAIRAQTFVRLTLGKYRGARDVKKAVATLVTLKTAPHLNLVTSMSRRDVTENFKTGEAIARLRALIGTEFLSATLFTTEKDVTLTFNNKGEAQISDAKPTMTSKALAQHNRAKQYAVAPDRPYLTALGVSLADGTVKPSMYAKYRQICHFIEIIEDLIRASPLSAADTLSVVDIGSGKGYLTIALYDFLTARLGKRASVTGIEVRPDMVALCSGIAAKLNMAGLKFQAVEAAKAETPAADITIALHACDTATDDAIAQGIAAQSVLIVCAPCCQHEVAPQLSAGHAGLAGALRFGLFKQRQADLVTDAARCLLLEASGYKVKVIEFVSTEHTAKNVMIAATRSSSVDRDAARLQYAALKQLYGFKTQHLEARLAALSGTPASADL